MALLVAALLFAAVALAQNPSPHSFSSDFPALSARANAARDANHLAEARHLYKQALSLRPAWAEGWWSLGTIAYDQNSYPEAVRDFRNATKFAPKNGNAYVMLGLSEFELGEDDLALRHIIQAGDLGLDQDPELRHVALYHQGLLQQRKGLFQSAQETLEQLCLQNVDNADVAVALGMTLLRQTSKTPPARDSRDGEVVLHVGRAGCLSGQKKYDEARAIMKTVVAGDPKYPGVHYAYGLLLVEASDFPDAVTQFKAEIENNPNDVISRLQIAAATYKTDSATGLPYAEEAVKLAPQLPFAHYLLGLLLLDMDNFQRAIPQLEVARKAFPAESRIYLALGTAYSRAGRKAEAARARAEFERLKTTEHAGEQPQQGGDKIRVGDVVSH
ncbi:MAG TPA: tetratricopeptide repeat protein [Verrucomicrobiae bacterium]|nr:tetratricopeptide repeat protein [Verrucomicrobiae bacterium]